MKSAPSFWSVPRAWEGEVCAVLASGAGMTTEVASLVKASGVRSIVVNNTFRLAPFADVLYAADAEWWANPSNRDAKVFAGLKVSVSAVPGVLRLRSSGPVGFDPDPMSLRTGRNSGYQAIHLAVHFGVKKLLLCGFNMSGPNWHGKHHSGLRTTEQEHYAIFRSFYPGLATALATLGIEVLNCTPGSALSCFPFADLQEALCPVP